MSKNVLYFAENAISPMQGGGIVVYASLKGLPPENLLGVYQYRNITPAPEYAERLHALPRPLRSQETTGEISLPEGRLGIIGEGGSTIEVGRAIAGPLLDRYAGGFERQVAELVARNNFHPEVIFTAPLSLRMLRLAVAAAKGYQVPIMTVNSARGE